MPLGLDKAVSIEKDRCGGHLLGTVYKRHWEPQRCSSRVQLRWLALLNHCPLGASGRYLGWALRLEPSGRHSWFAGSSIRDAHHTINL